MVGIEVSPSICTRHGALSCQREQCVGTSHDEPSLLGRAATCSRTRDTSSPWPCWMRVPHDCDGRPSACNAAVLRALIQH